MTIAEVNRYIKSYQRIKKEQNKEKATFDWLLADLIGKSISRIYSSSAKMPDIMEAYPEIFKDDIEAIQEEREKKQAELSALRFKQFAQSFNKRFEEVAEINDGSRN